MASNNNASLYSDDAIRQQIRICLMRIKRDEAFVDGELASTDYVKIKNGKDGNIRNKFVNYVSKTLLKKKKAMADFKKRLMNNNLLATVIAEFDPDTYTMEEDPGPSEKQRTNSKGSTSTNGDKKEADGASSKKRRRSSNARSGKESKKSRISFKTSMSERKKLSAECKMEFLSQKADVLERVPASHQKYWGQIMFGKWKKDPHRPVLVVGPYQVDPRLRETWMKMFENTKGDPQRMWCWVYWYGSPISEAFTQQKVSSLMPYEKAVSSNLHVPPASLKAKLESGKKLKGVEEQIMKGYACLEEELKKKPEERIPISFYEDFESILNLDDDISLPADDDRANTSDSLDSETDTPQAPVVEDKAPVVTKKKKSAEKKESRTVAPKSKPKPIVESPRVDTPPVVKTDDVVGEAEFSDGDQDHDDDYNLSEEKGEEDKEDEDLNFVDDEAKTSAKKKKKKKIQPAKIKSSIDTVEDSQNVDEQKKLPEKSSGSIGKPKSQKKKVKTSVKVSHRVEDELTPEKQAALERKRRADRLRKQQIKEALAYGHCMERYKSAAADLAEAVASKDSSKAVECMEKLKKGVKEMTAPFIEDFKIAQSMKAAKVILVKEGDQRFRKELWNEMKIVYAEGKRNVPEGWRARLKPPDAKIEEHLESLKNGQDLQEESDGKDEKPCSNGKDESTAMEIDQDSKGKASEIESLCLGIGKSRHSFGEDVEMKLDSDSQEMNVAESTNTDVSEVVRSTQPGASTAAKIIKKKSSLSAYMSLMTTDKPKESIGAPKLRSPQAPDPIHFVKKVPVWLTRECDFDPDANLCADRDLSLQFFEEAAACFPNTINQLALARALEAATFSWSNERCTNTDEKAWKMLYWEKVHNIVGACGGKHKTGTLVSAIMDGKYESAEAIVCLPDSVLFDSFLGRELNGSA